MAGEVKRIPLFFFDYSRHDREDRSMGVGPVVVVVVVGCWHL